MTEHPRDSLGRLSPDPSWPAERAAPGRLEVIRRLCNTINREHGADRLTEPGGLARWLSTEGLEPIEVSDADLQKILRYRDRIYGLARAHQTRDESAADLRGLIDILGRARYQVATGDDVLRLRVDADRPVDRLLGELTLLVIDAQNRDIWQRLKACAHCGWVIYDGSKNRSGRWCSMSTCGGRENARAYRRRRTASERSKSESSPT